MVETDDFKFLDTPGLNDRRIDTKDCMFIEEFFQSYFGNDKIAVKTKQQDKKEKPKEKDT